MSTLLLQFHADRTHDVEQVKVIAALQAMAQMYLETTQYLPSKSPETSRSYDIVLDNIARDMRRLIRNAMGNSTESQIIHKIDGYELCQLIYLLSGRNAEFE